MENGPGGTGDWGALPNRQEGPLSLLLAGGSTHTRGGSPIPAPTQPAVAETRKPNRHRRPGRRPGHGPGGRGRGRAPQLREQQKFGGRRCQRHSSCYCLCASPVIQDHLPPPPPMEQVGRGSQVRRDEMTCLCRVSADLGSVRGTRSTPVDTSLLLLQSGVLFSFVFL